MDFNAHAKPPPDLRDLFKTLQRPKTIDYEFGKQSTHIFSNDCLEQPFLALEQLEDIFARFLSNDNLKTASSKSIGHAKAYTYATIPGLLVIPGLLPISVQQSLLDRLLHRDLPNPTHRTNVHFHHNLDYPPNGSSFFSLEKHDTTSITPKNEATHKIMSMQQFLEKRLRWITLGGQYDWTSKQYPTEAPPPFPKDVAELLKDIFPETTAEAAILNLYSPGDTLSLHRDVSEHCGHGLISVSIGCECIFVIGLEGEEASDAAVLKLKSGDVVYMDGASRFAWHGVPRVVEDTCPPELSDWPALPNQIPSFYEHWRGWLCNKRINLNVRQMLSLEEHRLQEAT